jgi:23S rRNA G2069 N7-methylase RlmK/C1962 C5-methylase RlmI
VSFDRIEEHEAMLLGRLRKNRRRIGKQARREGVTCYRLYDRDIPEVPLLVDWYDGDLHVAERDARPTEDGDAGARAQWLERLVSAMAAELDVPDERCFLKTRKRQRGSSQYERFARAGAWREVSEGPGRFRINLSDYLDTGLFLDHRTARAMVAADTAGKRLLNLFAYTGTFSVLAALGGARETTSIDLSNTYLDWLRKNLALNELGGSAHRVLRADIMKWLPMNRERFDVIVLDPPTWSTSKSMEGNLDLQRDHQAMIQDSLAALDPGGVLYFSTNRRKLKLADGAFDGAEVVEITEKTTPFDFRRPGPHRCWRAVKP